MTRTLPNPVADTMSVRDVAVLVTQGKIRMAADQRHLEWPAEDVLWLLDSIYRGYPIGSLLFYRHPAPAKLFELGPLTIHAAEQSAALHVIDGQQRLMALAATLMRPDPIPTTPEDDYVVYFDPDADQFRRPPSNGNVSDTWVPLTQLLDPSKLSGWLSAWKYGRNESRRRVVLEAGSRLRDYQIPLYTIDEHDAELLDDIFRRGNSRRRSQQRVPHHVLDDRGTGPATLAELADALAELGMGRLDEQELLRCLIAFEGRDVARSPDEHHRTAARALPTLRRVLDFVRSHGQIPHECLLPITAPLVVLTRFFRLHPEPTARSLELLTRWLWRSFLAAEQFDEDRAVKELDDHEEPSVQRLLALLPRNDPHAFVYPAGFDRRAPATRVALLGLVSLTPRDLDSGRPLDVARLVGVSVGDPFRRILSASPMASSGELLGGFANRILLPGDGVARKQLLEHIESDRRSDAILHSHAIPPQAADALRDGQPERFLAERHDRLRQVTTTWCERLAAWDRTDRPSIDYLLESAE